MHVGAGFHNSSLYEALQASIGPLVALLGDQEDKTRANAAGALGNLVRNSGLLCRPLIEARALQVLQEPLSVAGATLPVYALQLDLLYMMCLWMWLQQRSGPCCANCLPEEIHAKGFADACLQAEAMICNSGTCLLTHMVLHHFHTPLLPTHLEHDKIWTLSGDTAIYTETTDTGSTITACSDWCLSC